MTLHMKSKLCLYMNKPASAILNFAVDIENAECY